ncbi:hypothetical protein D3C80_809850 [compost metagenome]
MIRQGAGHFADVGGLGEAANGEVGSVHHQHQRGLIGDGIEVVPGRGDVGGAHLHQFGAGQRQNVRDAKAAAYLDLLAPGDDHLAPLGYLLQQQKQRGRVVVHHQGVFGLGQAGEQGGDQPLAPAALAGGEIQL